MSVNRRIFLAGISALVSGIGIWPLAAEARPLVVLAAISLKPALERLSLLWREETGNAPLRFAFGASNALARQIELGAPGDCFLSADLAWMDYLAKRGLVRTDTQHEFVANSLVIIALAGDGDVLDLARPAALRAALGAERMAVARTDLVPAGRYARAALISLGVWEDLRKSLVETEHPRAALQLVALGEARLGIVYRSDARTDDRVRIVAEIPAGLHKPIRYPAAILSGSSHPHARRFLDWLGRDGPRKVFLDAGFALPAMPEKSR